MKKILLFIIILPFLSSCSANNQYPSLSDIGEKQGNDKIMYQHIRQPAVAGQFYPTDAERLKSKIKHYLNNGPNQKTAGTVKAVMAPHAGYDFSGPVAAYSYKALSGKKIHTAVIICNSHTAYFSGVAIDDSDAWQTPLGTVAVDRKLAAKLTEASEAIKFNHQVHIADHSLEVQLPFLQVVLNGDFKIVPVLFGNTHDDSYKKLARALADNLSSDDLVVISTDMSHYPSYDDAEKIDHLTLEMIKTGEVSRLEQHIKKIKNQHISNEETLLCGIDGVKTVLELSHLLKWDKIEILHYANSGDALIGDKARVVGYGSVVFSQTSPAAEKQQSKAKSLNDMLSAEQQQRLLAIAKQSVEAYVRTGQQPKLKIKDERLQRREGAFVTLHKNGQLRGCIGQIIPTDKPLWQVVRDMAVAACSQDHRFSPVKADELEQINYEVSVLSAPRKIDDWQKIELGKHGVIVRQGMRTGVFLPQVATETGWSREEFLSQLCWQKAGLSPDCYKDKNTELQMFTAQVFSDFKQ